MLKLILALPNDKTNVKMKKLLLILLFITLFSCSSNDDSGENMQIPSVETPQESALKYYFNGKLNDAPLEYAIGPNLTGCTFEFVNSSTSGGNPYFVSYGSSIISISEGHSMTVKFENLFSGYHQEEHAAFYDSFAGLTTNFLTEDQMFEGLKGVNVILDFPENSYSSLYGNQAGSKIEILSTTRGVMPGGSLRTMTIIGKLSCKLYNSNDPSVVYTITDAKFKLLFQAYY